MADNLRLFEAVIDKINLANRSDPLDNDSVNAIELLITELDNKKEDEVYFVNLLQLVADLACTHKGLAILEQHSVPQKLINIINEDNHLIVPQALKLFCRIYPTDLDNKYPQILERIFNYFNSDNQTLLLCALDFVAALARGGHPSRSMLYTRHNQFKTVCLNRLGSLLNCSDTNTKVRALQCIIDLLEIHDEDPKDESIQLAETIYSCIIEGEGKMTLCLLALCRQPFTDVRIHAMMVISIIANHQWGQVELANDKSFVTWLLDRSTEVCKEGKENKFEILKAIAKSPTSSRTFGPQDYMKIRADFKNGPFHVGLAEEVQTAQLNA